MAELETAQGVISIFPGLQNTDSFVISAFDMHVVFIVFMLVTALIAVWAVRRNYSQLFVRWMRLAAAFAFVAGIGVGELFEHTDMPPGLHFWHYMHLASGIAALWFFYLFTQTWDSKVPEKPLNVARDIVLAIIVMAIPAYGLFWLENVQGSDLDVVVFTLISIATLVLLAKAWKSIGSINTAIKGTFSLKLFLFTSILYAVIIVLFLLTLDIDVMGTALSLFGHNAITTLARIFQNMLYIVLTTAMMLFVFATMRADEYYAPIAAFIARKGPAAAPIAAPAPAVQAPAQEAPPVAKGKGKRK